MGLTASVKAADPRRGLFGLTEMGEKLVENSLKAAFVLALAHETAKLPFQRRPVACVLGILNLDDAEIRDVALRRIDSEDIAVGQRHRMVPLSAVIGTAW